MERVAHGGYLTDRVEQTVVVDQIFVAHDCCVHTGGIEMSRVREALVAQDIGACNLYEGRRQAFN